MATIPPQLAYVHFGSFSGSATSLRKALVERVSLVNWDLLPLSRRPSLIPARLKAYGEALRTARGTPWTKTRAWSAALQRTLVEAGIGLHQVPIVFVQTLPAFVLDASVKYVIYTDRVAREGAVSPTPFASRFSPGWLEREEAFLRGAYRIYLMGPSTVEVLERCYGIPTRKIIVVGAGPNMPLGPPVDSPSCRTMLFVGVEWERKGGPDVLAAFANVRKEFPDLELLLVGSDNGGRLPEGVRAIGRVPHAQMDALYSRADALVLPSHHDAVPITLLEALMKGLPCIGTTVGNMRWIIGQAGETVEPGRVDALSAALRKVVINYPQYRQRVAERRQYLRETFRWDAVASKILEDVL